MSPSAGALAIIMLATAGVSQATACTTPVYCSDGNAYTDDSYTIPVASGNSCIAECDGNCCTGSDDVCDGGRFAVCADEGDGSCYGVQACNGVGGDGGEVGLISGGSCVGYWGVGACYDAGYGGGKIGSISGGSCVGWGACSYAGRSGGAVGDISGSCVRDMACYGVGSEGGAVGDISDSCVGAGACVEVGGIGGAVGDISGSCDGTDGVWTVASACSYVGYKNSQFGLSLDSCCNGQNQCNEVGCNDAILCPSTDPSLPTSCSGPSPTAVPTAPTTPGKCKEKASEVEYKYKKGGKIRGTCGSLEKKKEKKRKKICKKKKKKKYSPMKKCPCVCKPFLE